MVPALCDGPDRRRRVALTAGGHTQSGARRQQGRQAHGLVARHQGIRRLRDLAQTRRSCAARARSIRATARSARRTSRADGTKLLLTRATFRIANRNCCSWTSRPRNRAGSAPRSNPRCTRIRALRATAAASSSSPIRQRRAAPGRDRPRNRAEQTVLTPDLPVGRGTLRALARRRVLAYAVNEDGYSRVVVQDFVTRRALPQPQLPRGELTGWDSRPTARSSRSACRPRRAPAMSGPGKLRAGA